MGTPWETCWMKLPELSMIHMRMTKALKTCQLLIPAGSEFSLDYGKTYDRSLYQ